MDRTGLRVARDVRASISSDGLVLLDVRGGLLLASNIVGARIWELIEQHRTRSEIARQLAADYGISVERTERDVAAFVSALVARGLIAEEAVC